MKKYLIFLAVASMLFAGEHVIPKPSAVTPAMTIKGKEAIGDFDGDKTNDLLIVWHDAAKNQDLYGVYSYSKNKYLIFVGTAANIKKDYVAADLNKDGKVELVLGFRIYSFDQ